MKPNEWERQQLSPVSRRNVRSYTILIYYRLRKRKPLIALGSHRGRVLKMSVFATPHRDGLCRRCTVRCDNAAAGALCVSCGQWDPYIMKEERNGTARYYGMCADLLEELARTLNFT